jgi:hypothetical protein
MVEAGYEHRHTGSSVLLLCHPVAHTGLELEIYLPQPLECWDYRDVCTTALSLFSLSLGFFFFFRGVWDWGFMLAKQVLYHLSHISSPFLLWLFLEMKS